ncbi:hypothetical protein LTS10_006675 [Elasticomyces elasticus]|nr:hypothetical protein LTS10_006675 [Elasticomyces elasticus]
MTDNAQSTEIRQVCGICGKGGYLFKCGRCSKPCQVKDWPTHKIACAVLAMPESLGQNVKIFTSPVCDGLSAYTPGILISLDAGDPCFSYGGAFLGTLGATDPRFVDLPITHMIGFPLGMFINNVGLPQFNEKAASLTFDVNPASAKFGQPTMFPKGGVIVARRDGRYIKVGHVMAVSEYLRCEFGSALEALREREGKGEKVDREEVVKRFLTPAAFESGCKRMREPGAGRDRPDLLEYPKLDEGAPAKDGNENATKKKVENMV